MRCTEERMLSLAFQSIDGVEGAAALLAYAMEESGWRMPVIIVPYVALALGSIEEIWIALSERAPTRRLGRAFAALALFRDWPSTMCGWPVARAAEDGTWKCKSPRCRQCAAALEEASGSSRRSDIVELLPNTSADGITDGDAGGTCRCGGT
jgi:hypothetical protein